MSSILATTYDGLSPNFTSMILMGSRLDIPFGLGVLCFNSSTILCKALLPLILVFCSILYVSVIFSHSVL